MTKLLIDKPGKVLKHSSSLRFIEVTVAICVLEGLAATLPMMADLLPFDPRWLTFCSAATGTLAWGARLVAQKSINDTEEKANAYRKTDRHQAW